MRSTRRLRLIVSSLIAVLLSLSFWTSAAAQEKPSRPEVQQRFAAALKLYNEGQPEAAAAALDEVLQMDPTSREVLDLREKAGEEILIKLLKDPKLGPTARLILFRAADAGAKIRRDAETIHRLIEETTSNETVVRWSAIRQLTAIGPFAVPQLLDVIFSTERPIVGSRKVAARIALKNMGPNGIPPLVVALLNAEDAARIAEFIAENPDARAVPALIAITVDATKPQYLRDAAAEALSMIVAPPAPVAAKPAKAKTAAAAKKPGTETLPAARMSAAQAFYLLAQRYYYADSALLEIIPDSERVLWRWDPMGKTYAEHLRFQEVPAAAYARIMASETLREGMQQKHSHPDLLELYVANNYMALEEAGGPKADVAEILAVRVVNEAVGAEYLYMALGRGLKDSNVPLARSCIEALASIGDPRPPRDNTLVTALAYPDKYVRIQAALALVTLSPAGNLGGATEAVRVMAAGLGARIRPRVAILTADGALYQRLGRVVEAADMVAEAQRDSAKAAQRVKELASPVSVLVIDARVEGPRAAAFVKSLRGDAKSAKLPIILLAAPNEVETLRADTISKVAAVLPLTADAAAVRTEIVNAAGSSGAPGAEDVRDNVELVRQILKALALLPPVTNYPTQDLTGVAAGFLRNQPDEIRILALRAIANLPQAGVRDMVYEIYAGAREPVAVRREAGAALQKLLVLHPRMEAREIAVLRSLTSDADEQIRMHATHALAIASIPQGEREASLQDIVTKLFPAPSAAAAPAAPSAAAVPAAPSAAAPPAPSAMSQADPREEPGTAIAEGIRLLEGKDYKTFVQHYTPPEAFNVLVSTGKVDDFAKSFGEEASATMLQVLKAVKDMKPVLSPDGKTATFKLKEPIAGSDSFSLVKIDKFWYLSNE